MNFARVLALALVLVAPLPASAQIDDDLGGRRAAVCAADVLDALPTPDEYWAACERWLDAGAGR